MWPFSSSSSSPSATSSPSASPVPPTGPVSIHPTLGRPLTNSEAADPKLNPRNPEGQKPCVVAFCHSLPRVAGSSASRVWRSSLRRSPRRGILRSPGPSQYADSFLAPTGQLLRLPRDEKGPRRLLPPLRVQRRRQRRLGQRVQGHRREAQAVHAQPRFQRLSRRAHAEATTLGGRDRRRRSGGWVGGRGTQALLYDHGEQGIHHHFLTLTPRFRRACI